MADFADQYASHGGGQSEHFDSKEESDAQLTVSELTASQLGQLSQVIGEKLGFGKSAEYSTYSLPSKRKLHDCRLNAKKAIALDQYI
jgi:hypothetical protein